MVNSINRYVHNSGQPTRGKILMVVSSPAVSEQTGWPIGFWAAELTHPMLAFREAGYEVDIASTEGGAVQMDAYSDPRDESGYAAHDIITTGFLQYDWFNDMLQKTVPIGEVDHREYDAIFLVGGQGPMYTFRGNQKLEALFTSFLSANKPAAAVCHATALLLEAKNEHGDLVVKHKTWTGFANAEEDYVDEAVGMKIQPYRIETEAQKLSDSHFKVSSPFSAFAIADGNLITGQQQHSGSAAAELVINQLESKHT